MSLSPATADRNLLYGILALQMDFISRDALIAAMNAWVQEKTKPLGQILREQGALRSDAQVVLEMLVQKHLEMHGTNAAKSLAALPSLGAVCEVLKQFEAAFIWSAALFRSFCFVWPRAQNKEKKPRNSAAVQMFSRRRSRNLCAGAACPRECLSRAPRQGSSGRAVSTPRETESRTGGLIFLVIPSRIW
jgi:hypothetical protein